LSYSKAGTKPISSLILALILLKYSLSFSKVQKQKKTKGTGVAEKHNSARF